MIDKILGNEDHANWHPPVEVATGDVKVTAEESKLEEISKRFFEGNDLFQETAPDFSSIQKAISEIKTDIELFRNSFIIVFHEDEKYGGGYKNQQRRISEMKNAVLVLEAKVNTARKLVDSNEGFELYKKQVEAAQSIVDNLKNM